MVGLLIYLVLLLVIMPGLLLFFGYLVKKYLQTPPKSIDFPLERAGLIAEQESAEPARSIPGSPDPSTTTR